MMERAILNRAASPGFWEHYAPWYEQWLRHNDYHEGILRWLTSFVKPGWRVLDIGAGSGILSLPLREKGCHVTALEPSFAMIKLLMQKALERQVEGLRIEKRRWEDVPPERYGGYDLVIACNSLHLSALGFTAALEKVFFHRPERLFVASEFLIPDIEISRDGKIPLLRKDYALQYARIEKVRSSFVYHNTQEALSHWTVIKGRRLDDREKRGIARRLEQKEKHFWMRDETYVGVYYWRRCNNVSPTVFRLFRKRRHAFEQSDT